MKASTSKPREIKDEALQKCILIGFSDRVARRLDQGTLRCELVHNRRGVLARESVVQHSPLFVVAEIREIEGRGGEVNTILSLATAIEAGLAARIVPGRHEVRFARPIRCDSRSGCRRPSWCGFADWRCRPNALTRRRPKPRRDCWPMKFSSGRLPLPNWDHGVEQWLARLHLLCQHCPELQLPAITEDDRKHIIEQLCHGAVSYKDIKEREVKPLVMSWLSAAQRELLDKHAPERLCAAEWPHAQGGL